MYYMLYITKRKLIKNFKLTSHSCDDYFADFAFMLYEPGSFKMNPFSVT